MTLFWVTSAVIRVEGKRNNGTSTQQFCAHWVFSEPMDHCVVMAARQGNRALEDISDAPRMAGPHPVQKHLYLDLGYRHGCLCTPRWTYRSGKKLSLARKLVISVVDAVGSHRPKSD